MATTALIRLSGPLQSYGTTSRWEERATGERPTKSAVVGLIANAMGRALHDDISDLAAAVFTVRADRPGQTMADFQTAGGGEFPLDPLLAATDPHLAHHPTAWRYAAPRKPARAGNGLLAAPWEPEERRTVLISKHYLTDAEFLAGLTTTRELARQIDTALRNPARLLFLGRRCCPPDYPLAHGTTDLGADDWPGNVPLLPRATTPTPQVWRETSPTPGTTSSPEQPDRFDTRNHQQMFTRTHTVHPPHDTEIR